MQRVTECHADPVTGRASVEERDRASVQHLALAGMGCPNCVHRIRNALLGTRGVVDVEIDLPAALATVWYRPKRASVADLTAAVDLAGEGTYHRYLAVPVPVHYRG
jgi:copper chaperone CopZ